MAEDSTPIIRIPPDGGGPQPEVENGRRTTLLVSPDSASAAHVKQGGLASQYTILERIGDGGMGVVYLAREHKLGRYVAVKRLNRASMARADLKARFFREAQAIAALNHIHIVHIYALGEDEDGPFIVMEYVSGPPERAANKTPPPPFALADRVHRDGPVPADEAVELILKISRAIEYAHSCGVIHRDLKPSNVLLDESGEPKIVDFGLARMLQHQEEHLTVPGEKMLSLGYGAPEQETDASITDERADVYGLGALLYFSLTGKNPRYFRESDVPDVLRAPINKALETDRTRRWPGANEFAEALAAVRTPSSVALPTVKSTWRCKWCDTVNPTALRYCGQCGWDGKEFCAECGAETRVGIQFCGECGADAREYEAVIALRDELLKKKGRKAFDQILRHEGRTTSFRPAGPHGQEIMREVLELRDEADASVRRRNQLRELIHQELKSLNYERALRFIDEYDALSNDQAFASERRDLPRRIRDRNLRRAREAAEKGDWKYAVREYQKLCREAGEPTAETRDLQRVIRRHRAWTRARRGAAALLLGLLAYLATAPAVYRLMERPARGAFYAVYRPLFALHARTVVSAPLARYAEVWAAQDMFDARADSLPPHSVAEEPPGQPEQAGAFLTLQARYRQELDTIEREYAAAVELWPREYVQALNALAERLQQAGDFEGWNAANRERERFLKDPRLPETNLADIPPELRSLQVEYQALFQKRQVEYHRSILARTRRYSHDLTDMQRLYTRAGEMELASFVNNEIKRVQTSPAVVAAEARISALRTDTARDEAAASTAIPRPAAAEEIAALVQSRETYQQDLNRISAAHAERVEAWPEQYIQAIESLMSKLQRAGDFEGWEAARRELERFEIDREINADSLVIAPADLRTLQEEHLQLLETFAQERRRQAVRAASRHIDRLSTLQTRLTMEGHMDEASVVNAEIRRVRSSLEVLEAEQDDPPAPDAPQTGEGPHPDTAGGEALPAS